MFRKLYWILLFCTLFTQCGTSDNVSLTILHTNDLHAHLLPDEENIGGAAVIAAYYKKVRAEQEHVLIFDAGDMVSGTPVSSVFKGEPVFRVLNFWGLDAAVLGNHDFDYGWQRIERYRDIATFPILCANAFYTGPDGKHHLIADADYKIFSIEDLRIGVIGVVAEWTPLMTSKEAVKEVIFVSSLDTLKKLVPKVSKKSNIVIILSHVGIEYDEVIAEQVENIDLIIGGHSHTLLKEIRKINTVPIVQAGSKGRYIGRIELDVDTANDEIDQMSYQVLPVNSELSKPDQPTLRRISQWEDQVADIVDRPLGIATENLSKMDMVGIADMAFLEATGTDYAFHNRGGIRGSVSKGPFTYRRIWEIFPFENTLVVTEIKGSDIPEGFLGKEPIDPEKEYRIVTNSFVRDQWDRIFPDYPELDWKDTGISLRDSVIRYIERENKIGWVKLVR